MRSFVRYSALMPSDNMREMGRGGVRKVRGVRRRGRERKEGS
jgi:hypothetical protein